MAGKFEKRGEVWTVRYRDTHGRQRRQSGFRSKTEAASWLDKRMSEQREGYKHDDRITFRELAKLYLQQHDVSDARIAKLGCMFALANDSFGDVPIASLTPQRIGAWRMTLSEGTRHDALAAVKQVLRAAVEWRILVFSPAASIKNPLPKRREITPFENWEEVDEIEACIREHYRGIPTIVTGTGLRPQEWTRLRWEHVDLDACVISLPAQIAKTGIARKIPLRLRVVEALRARGTASRGLVFTSERGDEIDSRTFLRYVFKPAQAAANLKRPSSDQRPIRRTYDMRHTYATWALRAGLNTFDVARRMGTSLEMIDETYGHHATDSEAHERFLLDSFDRGAMVTEVVTPEAADSVRDIVQV